jgi:hypothetical protein
MFDCLACNGTGCEVCDFEGKISAEAMAAHVNSLEAVLIEEYGGWIPEWMADEISSPEFVASWQPKIETFDGEDLPF